MMAALLDDAEIDVLVEAAISGGLADPATRQVLLQRIDKGFVAKQLGAGGLQPGVQIMSDLGTMNRVERLANGSVPLKQWLEQAYQIMGATEEGKVFRAALDRVARRADGEPAPPPAQALPGVKEQIIHRDDTLPVGFLAAGERAGRSVARLQVTRYGSGQPARTAGGDIRRSLGTGWVLSDRLLITNQHVIAARRDGEPAPSDSDFALQGAGTVALFDYDGEGEPGVEVIFESVAAADARLDYAILRCAAALPAPPLPLSRARLLLEDGDYVPVNIIQHPDGLPKRAAIRNNLVTGATADLLRYFTDTRFGSSGSPVFDDRWRVVGLHCGSEAANEVEYQGRTTAWVNYGAQIMAIVEHVGAGAPALRDEIMAGA